MAGVDRHPVQPPRKGAGRLHLAQIPIQLQEDLLGGVLCVLGAAQQTQRGDQHHALVLPHELLESRQVARLGRLDHAGAVCRGVDWTNCCQERQGYHSSLQRTTAEPGETCMGFCRGWELSVFAARHGIKVTRMDQPGRQQPRSYLTVTLKSVLVFPMMRPTFIKLCWGATKLTWKMQ